MTKINSNRQLCELYVSNYNCNSTSNSLSINSLVCNFYHKSHIY